MIIIAGTARLDVNHREAAIDAMTEMMTETQKEEGCVSYIFSADMHDDAVFYIFEEWESMEHLQAHFVAPHMAEFQAKIAELGERTMEIVKYEATEKAPL